MDELIRRGYFSDSVVTKRPHYHDCHQIIFITEGKAEFCVNEAKFTASKGSLIIFSRYENHSVNLCSQRYERYVLQIDSSVDATQNKIYSIFSNRPSGFCNVLDVSDDYDRFHHVFAQIAREYSSPAQLSKDMMRLLFDQLLILICRRLPPTLYTFDEENFEMVADIQRRFEQEYNKRYTLEGLAREYNISPSSLSHQFKKITGASVMGYLQSCRMATAKNYLSKTTCSIGEIVERCGFSDNSNFSRTFKSVCGLSPSEFRSKYK